MMNIGHVPSVPAMNAATLAVLDLLADPQAARKLMDELAASHARSMAAFTEASTMQAAVLAAQKTLDESKREFEQHRAAHSAYIRQTGTELDRRHTDADERERGLSEARIAHDAREAAVAAREVAVQVREAQVTLQERDLEQATAAHAVRTGRIRLWLEHFNQAPPI